MFRTLLVTNSDHTTIDISTFHLSFQKDEYNVYLQYVEFHSAFGAFNEPSQYAPHCATKEKTGF
jgi:hypothetical protein